MNMQTLIEDRIRAAFSIAALTIENESHMHAGSATESHFKLVLVSESFEGLSRVKRHQAVYKALGDVMSKIHALALHTFSAQEWLQQNQQAPASPLCAGVNK